MAEEKERQRLPKLEQQLKQYISSVEAQSGTKITIFRNNIQLITAISPCCGFLQCILKHALVLRLVGLVPHSSVSLLLGFSAMLGVS